MSICQIQLYLRLFKLLFDYVFNCSPVFCPQSVLTYRGIFFYSSLPTSGQVAASYGLPSANQLLLLMACNPTNQLTLLMACHPTNHLPLLMASHPLTTCRLRRPPKVLASKLLQKGLKDGAVALPKWLVTLTTCLI